MRYSAGLPVTLLLALGCGNGAYGKDDDDDRPSGSNTTEGGNGSTSMGPVSLPQGSREFDGVVNLVDATAAQELEDFLVLEQPPTSIFNLHGLNAALNVFLEHYVEQYDFVFFFTDHSLPTTVIGKFEAVTRPPMVGTGSDVQIAAQGYKTNGRVKGVIGIQYNAGRFGPFAHEMLHYWGIRFDQSFGFGVGLAEDFGAHWGYAGVHGQLGGFDPMTVRCETPADAQPPNCEPLPDGRVRHRIGAFYPNANGPNIDVAPSELYLMGLLPLAEVPNEIPILVQAQAVPDSYDQATDTVLVDADAVNTVSMAEIVAQHGEVELLSGDERQLSAAFVLLTATPAADEVLSEIAEWAAIFGNRQSDSRLRPFEELTGGLATLDTELGPRRDRSDPAPRVRPAALCDLLQQDCEGTGVGCYLAGLPEQPTFCGLSGGVQMGESCDDALDCEPGLTCIESETTAEPVCTPFCDHQDAQSSKACETLCDRTLFLTDSAGNILSGQCLPQ
jgi:hypothetical protein